MTALLALEPLARLADHPLARTSEGHKAGPIGLGVILLLCIACYFLFKSMSKHMRNVRENFPGAESTAMAARAATPAPAVGPASGSGSGGTVEPVPSATSTDTAQAHPPAAEA